MSEKGRPITPEQAKVELSTGAKSIVDFVNGELKRRRSVICDVPESVAGCAAEAAAAFIAARWHATSGRRDALKDHSGRRVLIPARTWIHVWRLQLAVMRPQFTSHTCSRKATTVVAIYQSQWAFFGPHIRPLASNGLGASGNTLRRG
jgi:hypothetical protein